MAERAGGPSPKEKPPGLGDEQFALKQRLLLGGLSVKDFLEAVFELDQSDPARSQAGANLELLADPDVRRLVEAEPSERDEYRNRLSLSYFHLGQQLAQAGSAAAVGNFKRALAAAELIADPDFDDWRRYVQATIDYLEGDSGSLEATHPKIEDERNRRVVARLIAGLRGHGSPDYARDYFGQKK